jgi:Ser/Thr protein kinase RdoA (MazF antagonist)
MTDYFSLSPEDQAKRLESAGHEALAHWGINGASLELIKHRENAVFGVEKGDLKAALRLHRHGYHSDDELRSELQWMQALSEAGVKVPNVIPTTSNELFISHSASGLPGTLQIDLFEWIDGEQLGSVEQGIADAAGVEATYAAIGELAARVHNQAASWSLPAGFVRHSWDAAGLAGQNPFWGQFWKLDAASRAERKLLERARDRVFDELGKLPKTSDMYSMIHADFAPENVMVDGDDVRLIDFDDAGFGWHLFELATSLYFINGEPYFDNAKTALIEGYRKHRPLTDEALESLPLHFLARGFTYVGWVHTRHETETAKELTPMLLALACELADEYLNH